MENIEEIDILEAKGDEFFQCLESQLKTSIPSYVKNILKMNGFYNAFMLSKLVDSKISQLEEFMRSEFASFMIPETECMDDYLGVYKNCQDKFKFLCGHKTLLEVMRDACRVYYPSSSTTAVTKPIAENIDDNSKDEIFQKLFDGVTNWLRSQQKYEQVLQLELNLIINCETKSPSSDEVSYSMKCPVSSCDVEKSFPVIWKSYARSSKNKSSAIRLCQPRWYFCSLKNHFQKCHLDVVIGDITPNKTQNSLPATHANDIQSIPSTSSSASNEQTSSSSLQIPFPSTSASAINEITTSQATSPDEIESVPAIETTDVKIENSMDVTKEIGELNLGTTTKTSRIRKTAMKSIKNGYGGQAKRIRK